MSEDISNKVKKIVADRLGIDEAKVTEKSSYRWFGADSLDIVELVMAFEEEFGSEISDSDAERILTVETLLNLLKISKLNFIINVRFLKGGMIILSAASVLENYTCKKISKKKTFKFLSHILQDCQIKRKKW